ncbi:MAG: hypothetical protein LBH63_04380 [Clostridiales Family XIII bacterium]|jgi:YbbR domain-containing protein|nr:hypothetical protein [Clostridiales Family XIII bacterium]
MFQNNKMNLILSIAAAVIIWAYVITAVNPVDDRVIGNVPVELINLDALADDGLTVSPTQTYTVDVAVRGQRSELSKLNSSDFSVTANLKGFSKGTHSVDVLVAESEKFTITEVRPKRIDIVVEDLVTALKPIRLSYSGKFPENTEPGFLSLSPQEIEIAGTREQVDSVSFIEAKVDVADLREEERTLTVNAVPVKNNGEAVYNLRLSQTTIDVTAALCTVKEVPLVVNLVGEPPEGIEVTKKDIPETIFIRGSAGVLSGIKEIVANDINIGSLRETAIITPILNLPSFVELANVSRNPVVTIEVEGVVAKNLSYGADEIEIVGPVSGYAAHLSSAEITVTVFGSKDQIEAFEKKDLSLYIELREDDYAETSVSAEIKFKYEKPLKRAESNPSRAQVVIEGSEEEDDSSGANGTSGAIDAGTNAGETEATNAGSRTGVRR